MHERAHLWWMAMSDAVATHRCGKTDGMAPPQWHRVTDTIAEPSRAMTAQGIEISNVTDTFFLSTFAPSSTPLPPRRNWKLSFSAKHFSFPPPCSLDYHSFIVRYIICSGLVSSCRKLLPSVVIIIYYNFNKVSLWTFLSEMSISLVYFRHGDP